MVGTPRRRPATMRHQLWRRVRKHDIVCWYQRFAWWKSGLDLPRPRKTRGDSDRHNREIPQALGLWCARKSRRAYFWCLHSNDTIPSLHFPVCDRPLYHAGRIHGAGHWWRRRRSHNSWTHRENGFGNRAGHRGRWRSRPHLPNGQRIGATCWLKVSSGRIHRARIFLCCFLDFGHRETQRGDYYNR